MLQNTAWVAWSSGKDSALTLYELTLEGKCRIGGLFTTIDEKSRTVPFHGTGEKMLRFQAQAMGIPLEIIEIPSHASNSEYEERLLAGLTRIRKITDIAFGDIYLSDIRAYRKKMIGGMGLGLRFPLWQKNTGELARHFIQLGFKALITGIDTSALSERFLGQPFDNVFLSRLPTHVDPCGENGEFHTFVYDGPLFKKPLPICVGGKTTGKRFHCIQLEFLR